jgi:hypothetical protein
MGERVGFLRRFFKRVVKDLMVGRETVKKSILYLKTISEP